MKRRSVRVRAPSNIAVIKYMGKRDASTNLPANSSLSLTLDSLCSFTELDFEPASAFSLEWSGLSTAAGTSLRPLPLKERDRAKMERHFERVLRHLGLPFSGRWTVRTGNAFPAGAGIASSASGFAALTLAIVAVCGHKDLNREELTVLSRQGSGSSCRSFGGPWVIWSDERAQAVESRFGPLADLVLLIDEGEKQVGSSEAHQRVRTSPLWQGRPERAELRIRRLRQILLSGDWAAFSSLVWEEAFDMHELFHTAEPPFSYWAPLTRQVLEWLRAQGVDRGSFAGVPVQAAATLDAGPNIHLLIPVCDVEMWLARIREAFPSLKVLVDRQGLGAEVLAVENFS